MPENGIDRSAGFWEKVVRIEVEDVTRRQEL